MDGSISFEIDPRTGVFQVLCVGAWTPEQAQKHFDRMESALHLMRASGRPVRVLVDLRQSRVLPADTSAVMAERSSRVHDAADRVAMVSASALHALQVKRDVRAPRVAVFATMEEAKAWIADAGASGGA